MKHSAPKQIVQFKEREYKLAKLIKEKHGLSDSAWETLGERNLLPPSIKLGRWKYFNEEEFETLLVQSMV